MKRALACALAVAASAGVHLGACRPAPEGALSVPAPGRVRQALSVGVIADLSAVAYAVPAGAGPTGPTGPNGAPHSLQRGDDGASFSGFVPLSAGDYTLEVVFFGVAGGERVFVGRWGSDAFTVVTGQVASTAFRRPLDTIGRPEDRGDEDGDGLGLLDELVWGADPSNADSDGDQLADGEDCDPADGARAFAVLPGGSLEDCDADGVRRPDAPYPGRAGDDCDDRDPAVHPGATDPCRDCNPATCPPSGPTFVSVTPPDGERIGCHALVRATITDDEGVVSVTVLMPDDPLPTGQRIVSMSRVEGDVFESAPFNAIASGFGLIPGPQSIVVRATDASGNTTEHRQTVHFAFDVPVVTRMVPDTLGWIRSPVTVELSATASAGIASVKLYAAARASALSFDHRSASLLGQSAGAEASIDIDPSAFESGDHLIYPVVEDAIGNALVPFSSISPIARMGDNQAQANYMCLGNDVLHWLPARIVTVGETPFRPTRMRERLEEAIRLAAAEDPAARLVTIIGNGLSADGTAGLDEAASYSHRWVYGFFNAASRVRLTVSWLTSAHNRSIPWVDPSAGNISAEDPIADPARLADSDVVAAAFATDPACAPLVGDGGDQMVYTFAGGRDVVWISAAGGGYWRAEAYPPLTPTVVCR